MPVCHQVVKAEMVLWTAGFVLLTLIINAPLLPWVLRVTGLNKGQSWQHCFKLLVPLHTAEYLHPFGCRLPATPSHVPDWFAACV